MAKPHPAQAVIPNWSGLFHRQRGQRRRYGPGQDHAGQTTSSGSTGDNSRLDYRLGLLIVAVITLACFNMAFFMRDGLPTNPDLASRLSYLTDHRLLWQSGWFTWMLSAIGLLGFCCLLLAYIPRSRARTLGLALVAIGIGPDIIAETLYAFVLPMLSEPMSFLLLDRVAMLLTGFIGNSAYCVGGLILNLLLFKNQRIPRAILYFGLPSWVIGLFISLATLAAEINLAALFTGVAMVWNVVWMFLFTQIVFRRSGVYRDVTA